MIGGSTQTTSQGRAVKAGQDCQRWPGLPPGCSRHNLPLQTRDVITKSSLDRTAPQSTRDMCVPARFTFTLYGCCRTKKRMFSEMKFWHFCQATPCGQQTVFPLVICVLAHDACDVSTLCADGPSRLSFYIPWHISRKSPQRETPPIMSAASCRCR